jgi:hypothetical protein
MTKLQPGQRDHAKETIREIKEKIERIEANLRNDRKFFVKLGFNEIADLARATTERLQ